MKSRRLTKLYSTFLFLAAIFLPFNGINQTSLPVQSSKSDSNVEVKPFAAEDLPRGVWDFEEMYYVNKDGKQFAEDKTIFFEFGEFFVYQKNKSGEFTTYLINADNFCQGTFENGQLQKVSFSVILWDTPIERVFNIHYLPNGKIEKVSIDYPKEESETKHAIYINTDVQ